MKVEVIEYSVKWKGWFETIANLLSRALNEVNCTIEHVGSTSVQGLDAKPVIDIDIIVADFSDLSLVKKALEDLGYRYKGDLGLEGREMFKADNPIHPHHLYVCDPNSLALKNHLLFRDHLRANRDTAQQYGALKRDLAKKYPNDVDSYCEQKSDFIAKVLAQCDFDIDEVDKIKALNTGTTI